MSKLLLSINQESIIFTYFKGKKISRGIIQENIFCLVCVSLGTKNKIFWHTKYLGTIHILRNQRGGRGRQNDYVITYEWFGLVVRSDYRGLIIGWVNGVY